MEGTLLQSKPRLLQPRYINHFRISLCPLRTIFVCVCVCDYYQLKRLFGSPLAMCVHSGSIEDPPVSTLWSCLLNSKTDKQHLPGTWPSRPLHRCLPTLSQSRCTWPPPPALPPSLWECIFSSAGAGARPLSNMLACADKSGRQR